MGFGVWEPEVVTSNRQGRFPYFSRWQHNLGASEWLTEDSSTVQFP
jgi:hypothetical protein